MAVRLDQHDFSLGNEAPCPTLPPRPQSRFRVDRSLHRNSPCALSSMPLYVFLLWLDLYLLTSQISFPPLHGCCWGGEGPLQQEGAGTLHRSPVTLRLSATKSPVPSGPRCRTSR